MGTVLTQIFLRLGRAREDGLIPDSTFGYFLQQHHDHQYPGKAFLKIEYNHIDAARGGFEAGWGEDTIGRFLSEEETEEVEGISQPATETSFLLRPTALPHGWNVVENGGVGDASSTCYEDGFTHSVTLTKPKVSPLQMRQLTVGVLQQHGVDDLSCHVDLLACMRAGPGQKERGEFAHDLEKRFPYYDDAWFAAEWNTEPNMVNVLQTLKEPWRIRTFTSLLDAPEGGWKVVVTFVAFFGFSGMFSAGFAIGVVYLMSFLDTLFMSVYTLLVLSMVVSLLCIGLRAVLRPWSAAFS